MTQTQTFTHYQFVPDSMPNDDLSIDTDTVRWHIPTKVYTGGILSKPTERIASYPTFQAAIATLNGGNANPTPVIPCGLFAECEHCAAAMHRESGFFVSYYNDVFQREEDLGPFGSYDDAARFADSQCTMFDDVTVMCPHGHSELCPHNCHGGALPTPPAATPEIPTLCPRCFRMLGQTDWCPVCQAHNDGPDDEYHPEDDAATPEPEEPETPCLYCNIPRGDHDAHGCIDGFHDPRESILGKIPWSIRAGGAAAALLLALTASPASASPAECLNAGTTGEGFPVVACADGSRHYLDMDGQVHENAAGAPVYCPGVAWIEIAQEAR